MNILLILIVVGIAMSFFDIDVRMKQFIYAVVAIIFVIWLFGVLGGSSPSVRIG